MTFYFCGCNYKQGKITVLKLENSHRICPFCLEDLASVVQSLVAMLGLVPSVIALRFSGEGGGQRLAAPSELSEQTAFPLGNA